jgi:hypothetical protein
LGGYTPETPVGSSCTSAKTDVRSRTPPRTYSTVGVNSGSREVSVYASTCESRLLKEVTTMSGDLHVLPLLVDEGATSAPYST